MWGRGWYGFGSLLMILVLAAVIAAPALLVRWLGIGDVFRRSRDAILMKHSNTVTARCCCGALI